MTLGWQSASSFDRWLLTRWQSLGWRKELGVHTFPLWPFGSVDFLYFYIVICLDKVVWQPCPRSHHAWSMSQLVWDAIKVMWLCNTTQSPRTLSALGMSTSLAPETRASNACVIALLGRAALSQSSSMDRLCTWQWGAWGFALALGVPHTIDACWSTTSVLERVPQRCGQPARHPFLL